MGDLSKMLELSRAQGYKDAILMLLDVAMRTGSPAAKWAAEYLHQDPDCCAPPGGAQPARQRRP